MTTTPVETLKESFRTIGKEYGFDNVDAEFAAFKDFKVKWQRSYRWAEFKISDYLIDAPREVLDSLAVSVFSKIAGKEMQPYSSEMRDWITSDDFTLNKQPIYLRRNRGLTNSMVGDSKNLEKSFDRLLKAGLVKEDSNLNITWTKENLSNKAGFCSAVMKVIAISSIFDDEETPDTVLDFVLYHEYMVMSEGKRTLGTTESFNSFEYDRKFPGYKEAQIWLNKLSLYL